jgi:hypothetical protein
MGKKLGTSGRIVRRKELKPHVLSDEALLKSAKRAALKHQKDLAKGWLHSN